MKKSHNLAGSIAALLFITALPQAARAASYYWDADGTTAGFGAPNGTDVWGTNADWTTDVTGVATPTAYTTTTTDDINFGYLSTGLAAGTVLVTGTQNAGTLTFASGSGAILLSGGTAIDLAAASTITVNNAADTITTPLSGAGTSLTKLGTGTLTLNGANTYTGTTIIGNGTLQIGDGSTGSLNGTTGTALTFSGTGTFNVQEADTVNQGMDTLSFNAGQGKVQNTFNATTSTLTFSGMNARSAGATANFTISGGTNGTTNKIVLSSTTNAPMSNSGSNNQGIFFGLDSLSTAVSYARYDATGAGYFRATNYSGDTNATTTAGPYGSAVDLSIVSTTSTGGSVSLNTLRAVPTSNSQRFDVGTNTLSINGVLAVVPSAGVQFRVGSTTVGNGFLQPTIDGGEVVFAVARGNSSALTTSSLAISNVIQDFSGGTAGTKVTTESNATMVFQASNTYTGVTTINSGLLRVLRWADAGSASGLGTGSTGTTPNAADIVINGGTLNYGNVLLNVRTNRLFTIGPAGATLDNSSNTVNTTSAWVIGQNSDGSSSGSIAFSDSNAPASLTLAHNAPAANQFGTGTLSAVLGDPGTGTNVTSLTKSGAGTWILSAANTYTGNTTVTSGTLTLDAAGTLKFVPTANGVCNKITGAGTATLNGTFNIDLTNAAIANGNSWTLVDTTTKNGTLTAVTGFLPESAGVWTKMDGNNLWTYTESTGVLGLMIGGGSYTLTYTAGANGSITGTSPQTVASGGNGTAVTAVPATNYHFVNWSDASTTNPRTDSNVTANVSVTANFAIDTYTDWAAANSVTGGVNGDSNHDGVRNGVAYFMGVTGQATNPGLNSSNEVTWPVNPDYQGTFEVQISTDLGTWTPATPQPTPSGGNLTYLLPPNAPGGKSFVRLMVTPD